LELPKRAAGQSSSSRTALGSSQVGIIGDLAQILKLDPSITGLSLSSYGPEAENDGTPAALSCDSAAVAGKARLGRFLARRNDAFASSSPKTKTDSRVSASQKPDPFPAKHQASALEAAQTDARCDRVVSGGGSTFCMKPIMPARSRVAEMSERLFCT
jgi:hypothetical protein